MFHRSSTAVPKATRKIRSLQRSAVAGKLFAAAAMSLAAIATIPVSGAFAQGSAQARAPEPARQAERRPNILFILVDDMGFGDLSVMGNRKVRTPNLDRLARDGVLLTKFYDAAPICSSSRAGFLTGRFPADVGFVGITAARARNAEIGQADWLDPKLPTIARLLQQNGYKTAHIGKWHLGGGRDIGDAPWPTAYGFDKSFTTFEGLGPRVLVSDEERFLAQQSDKLGQGPRFWEIKTNLTGLYADMTVDFVAQNSDKPWFVNLWLNDIHDPWAPDEESLSDVMGKGESSDDDRMLASLVKMDKTLGRLLERLDQMGEMDNTLVLFTSDNGPSSLARYHERGETAPGSTEGLRGRKFSLYEGGIRQPLIMHWRGHMKAGTRDEQTVAQGVDLLTTFASIIGAKKPAGSAGIDLSPTLRGQPVTQRPDLFWAYGKEGRPMLGKPSQPIDVSPRFAVREGDWKLLANDGGADVELYDLARDPMEKQDLAASEPEVRGRLLAKLRKWLAQLPK